MRVKEGVRIIADEKCDFFCDADEKRKQRRICQGMTVRPEANQNVNCDKSGEGRRWRRRRSRSRSRGDERLFHRPGSRGLGRGWVEVRTVRNEEAREQITDKVISDDDARCAERATSILGSILGSILAGHLYMVVDRAHGRMWVRLRRGSYSIH